MPDASKKSGFSLGGVSKLRRPMYRLPEVVKAVQEGRPVYVVEGEKDADTLAAMGLTATTNPGGASKPGQAIKWKEEHTQALAGAKVILSGLVASTPLATVEDLETEEVRRQRVLDVYTSRTPGYCIKDGCIARWDEGGGRALCTFVAYPAYAINTDNGVTRRGEYVIHAWDAQGNRLQPDAVVPYADFSGQMRWIETAWPMRVNVASGSTVRDNLRQAMTYAGMALTKHVDKYLHTGWREILERLGIPPRFLMYLYGRTGSGKSVTASLMLNYFARYDGSNFPASFAGSIGNLRQCAFNVPVCSSIVEHICTRKIGIICFAVMRTTKEIHPSAVSLHRIGKSDDS